MDKPELSGLIGDRLDQARSTRNTSVDALTPGAPHSNGRSLLTPIIGLLDRLRRLL